MNSFSSSSWFFSSLIGWRLHRIDPFSVGALSRYRLVKFFGEPRWVLLYPQGYENTGSNSKQRKNVWVDLRLRAGCWGYSSTGKAAKRCVLEDHGQTTGNSRKKEVNKKTNFCGGQTIIDDIGWQGRKPGKKHKSPTVTFNSSSEEMEVSVAMYPFCCWFWAPKNCPGQQLKKPHH